MKNMHILKKNLKQNKMNKKKNKKQKSKNKISHNRGSTLPLSKGFKGTGDLETGNMEEHFNSVRSQQQDTENPIPVKTPPTDQDLHPEPLSDKTISTFFRITNHNVNILSLDNSSDDLKEILQSKGLVIRENIGPNLNPRFVRIFSQRAKLLNNSNRKLMHKKTADEHVSLQSYLTSVKDKWIHVCADTEHVLYKDLSYKEIPMILNRSVSKSAKSNFNSDKHIIRKMKRFHRKATKGFRKTKDQRQYAYAVLIRANGSKEKVIGPYTPADCSDKVSGEGKRKKRHVRKHTEDLIMEKILKELETATDIKSIWIYSHYCPCLGRKDDIPCMIRLYLFAVYLGETSKIKTNIFFSGPYISSNKIPTDQIIQYLEKNDKEYHKKCSIITQHLHRRKFEYESIELDYGFIYKELPESARKPAATVIKKLKRSVPSLKSNYRCHEQRIDSFCLEVEATLRDGFREQNITLPERVCEQLHDQFQSMKNAVRESYDTLFKKTICEDVLLKVILHFVDDIKRCVDTKWLPQIFHVDLPAPS